MARKSRKGVKKQDAAPIVKKVDPIVTMQALGEMSDSDGELPPESEWNKEAKALKEAIENGDFEDLLHSMGNKDAGDDDSIEEVDLDDESGDDASADEEEEVDARKSKKAKKSVDEDSAEPVDEEEEADEEDQEEEGEDEEEDEEGGDQEEEESEDEEEEEEEREPTIAEKNTIKAKALKVVVEQLVAEKRNMAWAETFDVIPSEPLPFGPGAESLNIHDDLKREVAFYDSALQAVLEAKEKCKQADVTFTRPEDFFAEMVKTDEHMAKVKDRLIFEGKKMDAVAQRKSNKEQKLRSKESHSNKLAEKAKKKKDHHQAVEEWAQSAVQNRGRRLNDNDDGGSFFDKNKKGGGGGGDNKKREWADKKFGHGGKTGRFKQNDHASKNDMSGFNRNGNFGGAGTKKPAATAKGGAGANRKGKRARDSSRASR